MADKDKKPVGDTSGGTFFDLFGDDILTWFIGLIILATLLSAVLVPLRTRFGTLSPSRILAHYIFSDETPLGSMVRTKNETFVWSEAGGINLLGTQKVGALGTLTDGPVTILDERWWSVDFRESPDGWVRERDIQIVTALSTFWWRLTWISTILSLLLLTGIIYSIWRTNQIRKTERLALNVPDETVFRSTSVEKNERWERVKSLVESDNPNDWRAAIIEADIMLDELVTRMGYGGADLGDKLKGIEGSDFTSLDEAWEAHKVRNRIAHEGGDFILTQREAHRVVALFEKAFEEFDLI
ncbi:hypothetical protein L0Y40_01365 [Candidatus Wolfebacteria bacterium]|nr:hypothetical protein [Candidatus Wolfebacteria bacterium]